MKMFLFVLTLTSLMFVTKGCGTPTKCTWQAKEISYLTGGLQYGHCYDPKFKSKDN